MKILVIEDERSLAHFIEKGLQQAGYNVKLCNDGAKGQEIAATESFDLILLDLMLPGINGFDIIKNLRSFDINTPVFIVSALSDTAQVVKGFDLGAVDYIKKPFDWEELLARIRVLQKKISGAENAKLFVGDLEIDHAARKVCRSGVEIKLTAKEFVMLEYLARNANRVVSKNQIMQHVWEMDFDPGSNIVEVHIYQLRKKINRGFDTSMLETVVGLGYTLKGLKR